MSTEKTLEAKTKKELISLILDLENKLDDLKDVEKVVTTQSLPHKGLSVVTNAQGEFFMVDLEFNVDTSAASVVKLTNLHSRDEAIAMYAAKKVLVEQIVTYKQYSNKGEKK